MIFVSFTSAYIVRQGLPTFDSRTNSLVHDWVPVPLPRLLLVNTCVLLISSITIALARRQAARNAALTQVASIPGVSIRGDEKISWLALTVVLGLTFLVGQGMAWRELAAGGFYISATPSSSCATASSSPASSRPMCRVARRCRRPRDDRRTAAGAPPLLSSIPLRR